MRISCVWALAACLVNVPLLFAQEATPLGPPTDRAAEGFTSIFDVAELPDGRVLLTDNGETTLAIVDFEGGTVERLGRHGQGPREFLRVFSILPGPQEYRVYDSQGARFLRVSLQGEIVGTEPFVRPPLSGIAPPRGPDGSGGVYFSLRTAGPNGLNRSAAIYRWDTTDGAADSVGVVMQYAPGQQGRGMVPMPQADAWSVLPDGSLLRVAARDYHAEWWGGADGSAIGSPIPFPQLAVNASRRDAWIEGIMARPGGSTSVARRSDAAQGRQRTRLRRTLDADRFPEFLPAFTGGYKPAAPWGEVWLRLEPASDEGRTVFDVIGRRGELVRRVWVHGRARVVGFGPESVYIVRTDAYDLEWLERYDRPR